MKQKRVQYTKELGEQCVALYKEGKTFKGIGRILGVSDTATRRWVKKLLGGESPEHPHHGGIKNRNGVPTKAEKIRQWLSSHPDAKNTTPQECHADLGLSGNPANFYRIKKKFFEYQAPKNRRTPTKVRKVSAKKSNGVTEIVNLQQENAYLRWWNLGEREGFVERLMGELKK